MAQAWVKGHIVAQHQDCRIGVHQSRGRGVWHGGLLWAAVGCCGLLWAWACSGTVREVYKPSAYLNPLCRNKLDLLAEKRTLSLSTVKQQRSKAIGRLS